MSKRNTLIPLKDKIAILDKSYQALESFIKKRLFGFTVYDGEKAKKLKAGIFEKIARQDKINRLWTGINIPLAYNRAAGIAKERLEKIGAKVKKKRFDLVSSQSKKNGALRLVSYMDAANEKIKETVTQYFKLLQKAHKKTAALQNFQLQNLVDNQEILQGTEKIIKASIIPVERVTKAGFTYMATPSRGEVQRNIGKLFEKTFGDFDFISITMKNGKVRNYKPRTYMKMLARTEMRTIQTQAVKDRCREYQNDLVTIPPHDDPCPICEPFQGQVFSISGKHPFYPPMISIPAHPNCEDTYSPTSEEAIAIEKKHGKEFPEPYRGSVQDRIDELRKAKKMPIKLDSKTFEQMNEMEKAVNAYGGTFHKKLNPYLRGQVKTKEAESLDFHAGLISKYIKGSPKYNGYCYRLVSFEDIKDFKSFAKQIESGVAIMDKSFLSTSIKKSNIPIEVKEKAKNRIWLKIKSKSGASIDHISSNPGEDEILFDRNTKFRLKQVIKKEDEYHWSSFMGEKAKVKGYDYEYLLEEI
jgi:hypothetical protein